MRLRGDPVPHFLWPEPSEAQMSDDATIIAGTFRARGMLARSEDVMEDILVAFELMVERILDGEDIPLPEIADRNKAMALVRAQMVEEVNRHEKRVLQPAGAGGDGTIDFDVIRREIGSRLDRVRAARGSEGIS